MLFPLLFLLYVAARLATHNSDKSLSHRPARPHDRGATGVRASRRRDGPGSDAASLFLFSLSWNRDCLGRSGAETARLEEPGAHAWAGRHEQRAGTSIQKWETVTWSVVLCSVGEWGRGCGLVVWTCSGHASTRCSMVPV